MTAEPPHRREAKTVSAGVAHDLAVGLLEAAGTPEDLADEVARHLVWSERIGHSSHGLLRIGPYVQRIRSGQLKPAARPKLVSEEGPVTVIDGNWGHGQVAALAAVECGVEKARAHGVSISGAYNINHVGRLGDFTERCAKSGLVGILLVGGAPTGMAGNVAPFGGRAAVWGTNPIAIAIPTGDSVFALDFATSQVAGGKVAAAKARNELLGEDYLIDVDGRPSRQPEALETGGAIRPFGEHKGYGLAFAIELLAGAMVGAMAPGLAQGDLHNGMLLIVIDPARLGPKDTFQAAAMGIVDKVKQTPPAEGFAEVLVPGEIESRRLTETDRDGIVVPGALVAELESLGDELGVALAW